MVDAEILRLVAQAQKGDVAAFEEIVVRNQRRIRSYCHLMLGDRALADEAAQEVFLRAYQKLTSLSKPETFSTWLTILARNICIDELRKRLRTKRELLDNQIDLDENHSVAPADLESCDLLNQLFFLLPVNYRDVLILKEHHGYSYEELAAILKISVEGVRGQLRRAREKTEEILRHLLAERPV